MHRVEVRMMESTPSTGPGPVIPAPPNSEEQPFRIGDHISVFDAAMICAGRHPFPRFLRDGNTDERLEFLKAGISDIPCSPCSREGARAQRSWDILLTLIRRIEYGVIKPIARIHLLSGEIDPVQTIIRTADLAALATERDERPRYLRHLQNEPQAPGSEELIPPQPRRRPARTKVGWALKAIYPDGIPDQTAEPNSVLLKKVGEQLKKEHSGHISNTTILREAGRRK
jgi:hypothetical protein